APPGPDGPGAFDYLFADICSPLCVCASVFYRLFAGGGGVAGHIGGEVNWQTARLLTGKLEVRVLPPQLSTKPVPVAQRFLLPELLGAAAVLAAGSVGILPLSATPFLVVFGIVALRLRGEGARAVGLALRPDWRRTLLLGIGAGTGYQAFSLYVAEPALARLTGRLPDVSLFASLAGNVHFLLGSLALAWT